MKMKSMITGVSMAIAAGTSGLCSHRGDIKRKENAQKPHRTCYQSYR